MKKDNLNIPQIHKTISLIERQFNKLDEWLIPRDRSSFYLTHDFHPYFAAFPPELVSRLLKKYSKVGDVFLDPFMGGGSSIVEGYINKRETIGLDISPISKFIAETKTRPFKVSDKLISKVLGDIWDDISTHKRSCYKKFKYKIPNVTNIDRWFIKTSQFDLAIILHHIKQLKSRHVRNFLLLAFSSIIRKVSNATNGQLHLCTKKQKKIPSASSLFEQKVNLMSSQMKEYVTKLDPEYTYKFPHLYVYDIRKMTDVIKPNSVDIIITSPPYGTGSKYTEVYRLNFEWLEFKKPTSQATMEKARDFKHELKKALSQMYKVLKKNRYCFVVYGDPSTEDSLTKVAIDDALSIGFKYEGLITCPIKKVQTNHHDRYIRYIPKDFILIFKKS